MSAASWTTLGQEIRATIKTAGGSGARQRRAIDLFVAWAAENQLPFPAPVATDAEVLATYREKLAPGVPADTKLKADDERSLQWAREILRESRAKQAKAEAEAAEAERAALTEDDDADADNAEPSNESPEMNPNEEPEDEQYEEDAEFAEEAQAPKAKRPPPPRERVLLVDPRSLRPKGRAPGTPRQATPRVKGLEPRRGVYIKKRDEAGHVVDCDLYTYEDIGDMNIDTFLANVVQPRWGNERGETEYLVYSNVNAAGEPVGHPVSKIVEDEEDDGSNPQRKGDLYSEVDRTLGFVERLNSRFRTEQEPDPVLAAAKQQAAKTGDTGQMMMLMMMERMMSKPQNETELVTKVLDVIEKRRMAELGPAGMPYAMPPPPPPPPENTMMNKVMETMLLKSLQGGPTIIEQMQQMQALKQLSGSDSELNALRAELAALRGQLSGGGARNGFDESLQQFEKVMTTVKTIAPTLGGNESSGFAGLLKGLMTPETGKMISQLVSGAQPLQGAPVQAPAQVAAPPAARAVPPQAAQPQTAPPTQPVDPATQPPNPMPQAIIDAEAGIKLAQTVPVRAERFAKLVVEMYTTQHPYFQKMLAPALGPLMGETIGFKELAPARLLVMNLVNSYNPDWVTPEFADTILASLASSVGLEIPPALVETRGAWTIDFRGNVLELPGIKRVEKTADAPEAPKADEAPAPASPPKYPPAEPLSEPPADRILRKTELEETPPLAETPVQAARLVEVIDFAQQPEPVTAS